MLTVFYDGKCGLCSKEINYYKSIAVADNFYWFDVANDPKPLASLNVSQSDALRRLHALDEKGQIYIGVAAFVAIWQRLRYWHLLALLMKFPFLMQLASLAYNRFADYRFERLEHCQIAAHSKSKNC
jgi:predicted DCC family thiol-disulfide oxidoreductase YuxK